MRINSAEIIVDESTGKVLPRVDGKDSKGVKGFYEFNYEI